MNSPQHIKIAEEMGKLSEEYHRLKSQIKSIEQARELRFSWMNADAHLITLTIGSPNVSWVNSRFFEQVHEAVLNSMRARVADLSCEMSKYIKPDDGVDS